MGEWITAEGCVDSQKDSSFAKAGKPSAPRKIRCSLIAHRECCPFTGRTDWLVPPGPSGNLQNQHLFSSLCITEKLFSMLDTLSNED